MGLKIPLILDYGLHYDLHPYFDSSLIFSRKLKSFGQVLLEEERILEIHQGITSVFGFGLIESDGPDIDHNSTTW